MAELILEPTSAGFETQGLISLQESNTKSIECDSLYEFLPPCVPQFPLYIKVERVAIIDWAQVDKALRMVPATLKEPSRGYLFLGWR